MSCTRRTMLRATALGCGTAAMGISLQEEGAMAGVESCDFSGPGLYLYPHWGDARPYLVTRSATATPTLEFRDPADHRLLWTQTLSLTSGFAGKLG
jgi:hypothetical protein